MPDQALQQDLSAIDEDVIWRFETAWSKGDPLPIEEVLPGTTHPTYLATLEELILIEREWVRKWAQKGKPFKATSDEQYLRRFPALAKTEIVERLKAEGDSGPSNPTPLQTPVVDLHQQISETLAAKPHSNESVTLPDAPPGYEIFGLLGRGGMGVVYRARQISLNRIVALKVMLHGTVAAEEERQRFHTEAASVAALRHPQIVQLYEYGTWQGQPYIALECVEGGTLADRVARGPLPAREAAEILELLALAIAAAHDGGIIHRDLKPSNVLIDEKGRPKISDFGLAKQSDAARKEGSSELTQTGMILGTPAYMSPEQARGEKQIGPAADIYALGTILYQLLTGKPPFLAATAFETLQQVQTMEPVSPRRLVPGLPRDLNTICLKCLEKEPPRRYHSAHILAGDLRAFLTNRPITARPVGELERTLKWVKRQPVIAALSLLLAISLSAGLTGIFWQWRSAVDNFKLAERRAENERKASDARAQALQEMQGSLYLHRIARADRAWWDFQIATADQLLEDCPEELRDWEWQLLKQRCHSELLHVDVASPCVAFHPNGTDIAIASENQVQIRDATKGEIRRTIQLDERPTSIAFHPTGDKLAIALRGRSVSVWDLVAGKEIRRLPDHPGSVLALTFNPAGDRLVCGTGVPSTAKEPSGEVWIWDLARQEPALKLFAHKYAVPMLAFSRDGRQLVTAAWDHNVIVWNALNGDILTRIPESVHAIDISPDGNYLAAATVEHSIKIWELKTKQIVATLSGHSKRIDHLAFSRDGTRLASAGQDASTRIWDWRNRSALYVHRGHTRPIEEIAWSPDGERLATTAENTRIWSAASPQEGRLLTRAASAFALSPDGRHAATATHGNHTISIWNLFTGDATHTFAGHTHKVTGLAFANQGDTLISTSLDTTAKLWGAKSGQLLKTLPHDRPISSLAVDSQAGKIATGCDDGTVVIWDIATASKTRQSRPVSSKVISLAFHKETSRIAVADSSGEIVIHNTADDSIVRKWTEKIFPITCLAFIQEGSQLMATCGFWDRRQSNGSTRIWDVSTGEEASTLQTPNAPFFGLATSPDGKRIATAGQSIQLWEPSKRVEVIRLELPDRLSESYFHVRCGFAQVQFSSNGVWLGARALDGSVWLWGPPPIPRSRGQLETISWEEEIPHQENNNRKFLTHESFSSKGLHLVETTGNMIAHRELRGSESPNKEANMLSVLPVGHTGWLEVSKNSLATSFRVVLQFDRPARGVAVTRIGGRTGASLPIWRMEALDIQGNIVDTTGEIDWSMDGQPRTFQTRGNNITAVRILTFNRSDRNEPFSTWTHLPITRLELER